VNRANHPNVRALPALGRTFYRRIPFKTRKRRECAGDRHPHPRMVCRSKLVFSLKQRKLNTECVDTVSNCRSNSKGERWNEDLCRGVGIDDESDQVPKGYLVDALALRGDEGRGTLRYAARSCEQALIRGFPNGETHLRCQRSEFSRAEIFRPRADLWPLASSEGIKSPNS
jgi:hypothetical protein